VHFAQLNRREFATLLGGAAAALACQQGRSRPTPFAKSVCCRQLPLIGIDRTSIRRAEIDAIDPDQKSR